MKNTITIKITNKQTGEVFEVTLTMMKGGVGYTLQGTKEAQEAYMQAMEEQYLSSGGWVSHGTA